MRVCNQSVSRCDSVIQYPLKLSDEANLQVGHMGIELFKFQKASYGMIIDDFEYEGFLNWRFWHALGQREANLYTVRYQGGGIPKASAR